MTTYRAFVDGLEAISVTGVVRSYTQGPPSGSTGVGDCPAMYVNKPGGDERSIVFGSHGGQGTKRAEIVILVEPVAQNRQPENFDNTVDMMDNLSTALQNASCLTKSKLSWSMDQTTREGAGLAYWAVVATVEGHG